MDPAARRNTWHLLKRIRKNRTVIMTTHFMDEADLLGDRIAMMQNGEVKCCGTSAFLKDVYGKLRSCSSFSSSGSEHHHIYFSSSSFCFLIFFSFVAIFLIFYNSLSACISLCPFASLFVVTVIAASFISPLPLKTSVSYFSSVL